LRVSELSFDYAALAAIDGLPLEGRQSELVGLIVSSVAPTTTFIDSVTRLTLTFRR
jgi:hypothetical protein